ncbi:MAG: metal-dependent hydrolase [Gammaproteobacteria bacterium]|nr:metal-dependent hydrolase [Gammaproteobacteria bacterium]
MRQKNSRQRLFIFCLMGFSLSGVLDACTSYGTHLFWPISDERVAWHIISIIDPVFFSLILLLTLVLGWRIQTGGWPVRD